MSISNHHLILPRLSMYTREQLMEYTSAPLIGYRNTLVYPYMNLRAVFAQKYLDHLHNEDLGQKLKIDKKSNVVYWEDEIKKILTKLISEMNEKIAAGVGVHKDMANALVLTNPEEWKDQ